MITLRRYEEMNQTFLSQIQKLASDAEQLAPNMKAVDRLDNVMERLKQTSDEFDVRNRLFLLSAICLIISVCSGRAQDREGIW